jgi:DNA-binding transcriptional LysR family regulator
MLEVGRLRLLLAISEHGGPAGAARALGLAPGEVAGQLAGWEGELGLALTDGDRLTPAGRRLAEHAGRLLTQLEAAESDAAAVAGRTTGTLRLGVGAAAGRVLLGDVLAAVRSSGLMVFVRQLADEQSGAPAADLDVTVVGSYAAAVPQPADPAVQRRELLSEPLLLAVPSAHRAAGSSVRLADLSGEAWIGGTGDGLLALERAAAGAGFAPRLVASAGEDALALTLVAAGHGVALVPASAAPSPLDGVRFLTVLDGGLRRTVLAVVRRSVAADPGVRHLLDALAAAARRVAAAVPGVTAPPAPAPARRPDPLNDPLPEHRNGTNGSAKRLPSVDLPSGYTNGTGHNGTGGGRHGARRADTDLPANGSGANGASGHELPAAGLGPRDTSGPSRFGDLPGASPRAADGSDLPGTPGEPGRDGPRTGSDRPAAGAARDASGFPGLPAPGAPELPGLNGLRTPPGPGRDADLPGLSGPRGHGDLPVPADPDLPGPGRPAHGRGDADLPGLSGLRGRGGDLPAPGAPELPGLNGLRSGGLPAPGEPDASGPNGLRGGDLPAPGRPRRSGPGTDLPAPGTGRGEPDLPGLRGSDLPAPGAGHGGAGLNGLHGPDRPAGGGNLPAPGLPGLSGLRGGPGRSGDLPAPGEPDASGPRGRGNDRPAPADPDLSGPRSGSGRSGDLPAPGGTDLPGLSGLRGGPGRNGEPDLPGLNGLRSGSGRNGEPDLPGLNGLRSGSGGNGEPDQPGLSGLRGGPGGFRSGAELPGAGRGEPGPDPRNGSDLPAPGAARGAADVPGLNGRHGTTDRPGATRPGPELPSAGAPRPGSDLPRSGDLPAPGPSTPGPDRGEAGTELPAPGTARGGLPAPGAGPQLPGLRGLRGGSDRPAPGQNDTQRSDLPAPGGAADLPGTARPGRTGSDDAPRTGDGTGLPGVQLPSRAARRAGAELPPPGLPTPEPFDSGDLAGLSGLSSFGTPAKGLPKRTASAPGDLPAPFAAPPEDERPSGRRRARPDTPGPNPYRADSTAPGAPDPFRAGGPDVGPNPYRAEPAKRGDFGATELFGPPGEKRTAPRPRSGSDGSQLTPAAGLTNGRRSRAAARGGDGADGTLPPATGGEDVRLSIFEDLQSEWFTQGSTEQAKSPGWQMAADDGWRAAARLAEPTTAGTTSAGLPRRRPQAMAVPGAVGTEAPRQSATQRSPQELRGRLSSYADGVRRGRHAERASDD